MPEGETIVVAIAQYRIPEDRSEAIKYALDIISDAAEEGAQLVLLPELFQGPYFCKNESEAAFEQAKTVEEDPAIAQMQSLAQSLGVVLPVSFFERENNQYYNSLAMIDSDGKILGVYRKSHIPDGPGYEEKFYFRPGNTGFKVWETKLGKIGVGICWDQWFPEAARAMTLMGADLLLYPTAIGSEPGEPDLDTRKMWRRVMIGHAVANAVPIIAANRIGDEEGQSFYGNSFICDAKGELLVDLDDTKSGYELISLNLKENQTFRATMGFFRDRRPELYGSLSQDL